MSESKFTITIDDTTVSCQEGMTILEAAAAAELYIPRMCHHSDLPHARDIVWAKSVHQGTTEIIGEKPEIPAGDDN